MLVVGCADSVQQSDLVDFMGHSLFKAIQMQAQIQTIINIPVIIFSTYKTIFRC